MPPLIDTHAHLEEIEDLPQTITESKSAGLIAIVAVGSDLDSNRKVLALSQQYQDFIYPALGLHPWYLADANINLTLDFIETHINQAVAIGEIGLDYHKRVRQRAEKTVQADVLRKLLKLAKKYAKPALIHSRYAWRDSFNLVEEARLEKAVFHWYTGTTSVLRDIIRQGYYISATPAAEYHEEHRRAVREVPLERLLLETDSPVVYRRGTQFEFQSKPADVLRSLKAASQLRNTDEFAIASATTKNAQQLFSLT